MSTPVTAEVYLNQATDDDMSVFCPFGFVFCLDQMGFEFHAAEKKCSGCISLMSGILKSTASSLLAS